MSRRTARPSVAEALKQSERFSHPSPTPLENALDFLLTPQHKLASHSTSELASHTKPVEETSKLATQAPMVASLLSTQPAASYPRKDRHDRSKVQLNIRIGQDTDEVINNARALVKMTRQEFVEVAIHKFAEWLASNPPSAADSKLAHDELMSVYKTDDAIITLYAEMTGNRWKPNDDREAVRFNGADLRLIERGMLATVIRFKGKRINSFKYFVSEIELALEQHSDTSDDVKDVDLASLRRYWDRKKAGLPLLGK